MVATSFIPRRMEATSRGLTAQARDWHEAKASPSCSAWRKCAGGLSLIAGRAHGSLPPFGIDPSIIAGGDHQRKSSSGPPASGGRKRRAGTTEPHSHHESGDPDHQTEAACFVLLSDARRRLRRGRRLPFTSPHLMLGQLEGIESMQARDRPEFCSCWTFVGHLSRFGLGTDCAGGLTACLSRTGKARRVVLKPSFDAVDPGRGQLLPSGGNRQVGTRPVSSTNIATRPPGSHRKPSRERP